MKKKEAAKQPTYRIAPDAPLASAWKVTAGIGVIGIVLAIIGMFTDPHRFAFSWLFAFLTFLAVGLGGLFFTIMLHLTGGGWGVTVRRTSEFLMSGLPVFALLFVPIAMNLGELYPWYEMEHHEGEEIHDDGGGIEPAHEAPAEHGALGIGSPARAQERERDHQVANQDGQRHPDQATGILRHPWDVNPSEWGQDGVEPLPAEGSHTPQEAEHHHVVGEKLGYFHLGGRAVFFFGRAAIYFIAWIVLAYLFFTWSTRQDKEKGLELTKKMQRIAPVSTFVFGLSLTFAIFDWSMSLEPSWYSTIFGVQYFAVSAVIGLVAIILLTMQLRRAGVVGDAINVEHYHDLGKLTHGFIVFWAYISFSQFMLIWYVGIPEEATYYHLRWWGGGQGYQLMSVILILAHFVVPFFILLSRNIKRRPEILGFAAVWLAVMHVVQVYWLIMPYAEQTSLVHTSLHPHWLDIACLCAVGGTYLTVVLWQMTRFPLVPVGDPRLERALHFENA
jgi:hypothetical protein